MRDNGLRGDTRNDPIGQAITAAPEMEPAFELRRRQKMQDAVCEAIQSTDDRKLCAWVTVAVWEDEDGTVSHSLVGDDHSSFLELKGYLHDGVWAAAHTE